MTNRPSGPVVPARTEPYPVRFLTAWLLACSIPAMAIICVKAIQKVRADNRVAAACERIADAVGVTVASFLCGCLAGVLG